MITLLLVMIQFCPFNELPNSTLSESMLQLEDIKPLRKYQFDEFREGTVFFKNGTQTKARMNYNYVHGAVEFIHERRDTMLLTGKSLITHLKIVDKIYYPKDKGEDTQLITLANELALVKTEHYVLKGNSKSSSDQKYVVNNSTPGNSALLVSNKNGEFQWQNNSSAVEYGLKADYFLMDFNKILRPATRANFLKVFSKQHVRLSEFIKDSKINFKRQQDLIKLLNYCIEKES